MSPNEKSTFILNKIFVLGKKNCFFLCILLHPYVCVHWAQFLNKFSILYQNAKIIRNRYFYLKWGLKFYIKHNFCILTMNSQTFIFKLAHTLWGFMVDNWFQYKNDISNLHFHICHWSNSFIGPPKLFFWC